jgi:hypothetical protein
MKRKFLFTFILAFSFLIVLAISASASTIYKNESGDVVFSYEAQSILTTPSEGGNATLTVITTTSGEFAKTDANGVHLTWYITATTTENGNTVHSVACVPTLQAEGYDTYAGTLNSSGAYNYSINKKKVVSASFPDNAGIKTFGFGAYGGYGSRSQNNILFCYMPNTITALDESMFQETPILTVELDDEAPMTAMPAKFVHAAWSLRGEVHIPASVERIASKGSYGQGTPFYQTYSLESITFSNNSKLKTVDAVAFAQSGVKYITLPDSVESLGQKAFIDSGIINSPFTENSRCTTWSNHIFRSCLNLKNFIVPGTLTTVAKHDGENESSFALCKSIEKITYGKGANDSTMFVGFFANATIGEVVLPEGITHIPARLFHSCKGLTTVKFPNSVETAGERVFESSGVKKIILGASFKYFTTSITGNHRFSYLTDANEFYIPASFYAQEPSSAQKISYAFSTRASDIKFFYTGTAEQLADALDNFKTQTEATTENWKFTGATPVDYADYLLDKEKYASGRYIIYNYNVCDAFYESIHEEDGNTCVINCERCNTQGVMEENPVHIMLSEISYALGYATYGELSSRCTNEGCICASAQISVVNPIFNSFLYSTRENEALGVGLVLSIGIDKDALATYEEISKSSLKYGALAVAGFNIGNDGSAFDNEGKAVAGAICAEVSASGVSKLDLVIRGSAEAWDSSFEGASEGQTIKDLPFYVLGFFTDGNGTSYFYGEKSSSTLLDLDTITYNSIS